MIGYLKGKALSLTPERVLLDVQGVGYAVFIPLSTYYELEKAGEDTSVGLFIHTHLREGELSLYGFRSEREQLLFERLIGVSGIGPKLARVVLSGMAPEELIAALAMGDVNRLTAVPGIGKKTAQRMVLELKDKVRELVGDAPETTVPSDDDVVSALVNLGYKASRAAQAVADSRRDNPSQEFHQLLRASLQRLSRA